MDGYGLSLTPVNATTQETSVPDAVITKMPADNNETRSDSVQANIPLAAGVNDCLFYNIDAEEPKSLDELDDDRNSSYFLKRRTGAPVSRIVVSRLEELSFVKLFP